MYDIYQFHPPSNICYVILERQMASVSNFNTFLLRLPVDSGDLSAFQLTAPHGTSALLSQETQAVNRAAQVTYM